MRRRGRKRRRRAGHSAAARRAAQMRALGELPLGSIVREGLLAVATGPPGPERTRATAAELAHVERLAGRGRVSAG